MSTSPADPRWVTIARRYVGVAEVPGKESNPVIANMWREYADVWRVLGSDDSRAPWCGTFVAYVHRQAGLYVPQHPYRARSWLSLPFELGAPMLGCVVIFARAGGGHVGWAVGRDELGRLMVLGANQRDSVSIAPFETTRVLGYRAPSLATLPPLPLLSSRGAAASTNEA